MREQLVSQIIPGITSADLKPGQRLPSTRELARRFHIHSNTVIAAYRDLEARGWIELRQGSGGRFEADLSSRDQGRSLAGAGAFAKPIKPKPETTDNG